MTAALAVYRSSIGKKVIMAVSGFILVGFVVFHMYGNTKMYLGAEEFNAYAVGLRELGKPVFGYEHLLWIARVILLAAVVLHIWAATALTMQSRAGTMGSRSTSTGRYSKFQPQQATYASRTMRWGGVIIFLFIVFHVLHLTFGAVGYGAGEFRHPEGGEYFVYNNVVQGFLNPWVSGFYILAMLALGLHLYHGVWSMFQTLGLNSQRTTQIFRGLAILVALVVVVGNISFPIAVLLGIVAPETAALVPLMPV